MASPNFPQQARSQNPMLAEVNETVRTNRIEKSAMTIPGWDTSTWASVVSAAVTVCAVALFVWFEWYRRPRLDVTPTVDGPTAEWIHLLVQVKEPAWRGMPRDIATDCEARISFLDPVAFPVMEQELLPQITPHWVGRPEPRDYYDIPMVTVQNVGFHQKMLDVLRRRTTDGTTYAADPWYVYSPPWKIPQTPPPDASAEVSATWSERLAKLEREWEIRRLKQRVYIVRVELYPANGWPQRRYFRLTLPAGMGAVDWRPDP